MKNTFDLTGKTALITGASSGIGAAAAKLMASLGASIAIGYFHNERGAVETRDAITAAGGKAVAIGADVRTQAECRRLVREAAGALGAIDILVNNAGALVKRTPLLELSEAELDDILALNLKSALFCYQEVAGGMVERKSGAVINVVSIAGRHGGGPGAGAYSTAKGALITMTKSMAREMAAHGVRVNAVSPGVIATPFHEMFSTPEMIANMVKMIPMGRTGTSEECAGVIAFLASDAAAYVAGETIEVNGGQLML